MTEEQIERIAELVFQKLVKKQEEWDKEFHEQIKDQVVYDVIIGKISNGFDDNKTKIANLQKHLDSLVEKEMYAEANIIKKKIEELKNKLNE